MKKKKRKKKKCGGILLRGTKVFKDKKKYNRKDVKIDEITKIEKIIS